MNGKEGYFALDFKFIDLEDSLKKIFAMYLILFFTQLCLASYKKHLQTWGRFHKELGLIIMNHFCRAHITITEKSLCALRRKQKRSKS